MPVTPLIFVGAEHSQFTPVFPPERTPVMIEMPDAKDPELCAIGLCMAVLEGLPPEARLRLVNYLKERVSCKPET